MSFFYRYVCFPEDAAGELQNLSAHDVKEILGKWPEFHDTGVPEAVVKIARQKIRDYVNQTAGSDSD